MKTKKQLRKSRITRKRMGGNTNILLDNIKQKLMEIVGDIENAKIKPSTHKSTRKLNSKIFSQYEPSAPPIHYLKDILEKQETEKKIQ